MHLTASLLKLDVQRPSGFEVPCLNKIDKQAGLRRMPTKAFSGQLAGRGVVHRNERCEKAELLGCLSGRFAHDGYTQLLSDQAGNLSKRDALLGDTVIGSSCPSVLKCQAEKAGSIEPVDRRPSVEPVAHIDRFLVPLRDLDDLRSKAVIASGAMNDRWRADRGRADAAHKIFVCLTPNLVTPLSCSHAICLRVRLRKRPVPLSRTKTVDRQRYRKIQSVCRAGHSEERIIDIRNEAYTMRYTITFLLLCTALPMFAQGHAGIIRFGDQMELVEQSDGWQIKALDPKDTTFASVHDGDVVERVNGTPVSSMGALALFDTFNECSTSAAAIVVKRNKQDVPLTLWCDKSKAPEPSAFERNPVITLSKHAPEFSMKDVTGHQISLKQYRGRWVLLNFWGTWCPPCVREISELATLSKQNERQLTVIGLSFYEEDGALPHFLLKHPVSYTVVDTTALKSPLPKTYGVVAGRHGVSAPVSFLVSPNGEIRYIQAGAAGQEPSIGNEVQSFISGR